MVEKNTKKTEEKKSLATSTRMENRMPIFQPTNRPQMQTVEITTKHGTVKITGRLGQVHKDLLEAVKYTAIDFGYTKDGRFAILIDPYKLRKALSGNKGLYNYETMHRLFDDLIQTIIDIDTPTYREKGSFLHIVREAKMEVMHSKLKTPRKYMAIEFGSLGTSLIKKDFEIFYDPLPIINLRHGVSKAIARHVLSHPSQPNGGWKLDTLIYAVLGENAKSQEVRDARRRIKQDAEKLKDCGIIIDIDSNRVFLAKEMIAIDTDSVNTESVSQKPESVSSSPESVAPSPESEAKEPESVAPSPESVAPSPESVAPSPESEAV